MSHILRTGTQHITVPLADEDNYAYASLEEHTKTLFDHKNDAITARPQLHQIFAIKVIANKMYIKPI